MKFIDIKNQVLQHQHRILMGVPDGVRPQKMLSSIIYAIGQKPELINCHIGSILGASIVACNLGLAPDGILGEGYFSALHNQCQFLPGYKGLEKLAYRGGVDSIWAECVYQDDTIKPYFFTVKLGTEKRINHRPNLKVPRLEANIVHFYAIYKKGVEKEFKVLTRAEVDDLKLRYMAVGDQQSAWLNFYPAMGKKSALTQLLKHSPLSADVSYAIGLIETNLAGKDQQLHLHLEGYMDNLVEEGLELKAEDDLNEKAKKARQSVFDNANKSGKK